MLELRNLHVQSMATVVEGAAAQNDSDYSLEEVGALVSSIANLLKFGASQSDEHIGSQQEVEVDEEVLWHSGTRTTIC